MLVYGNIMHASHRDSFSSIFFFYLERGYIMYGCMAAGRQPLVVASDEE
jgi:hypothetical protein